jgi:urease accessory protein
VSLAAYGGAWNASLDGHIALRHGKSQLMSVQHSGPLRLQKALWPEGQDNLDPVHLLLVHPPGGIAAGDSLSVKFSVGDQARVLITTPGAGKWYRSVSEHAGFQRIELTVGHQAVCEWLPQEVIVHDGAKAKNELCIRVEATSVFVGSEVLVFGRKAHGEFFSSGHFQQQLSLIRNNHLNWSDKSLVTPKLLSLSSAMGVGADNSKYHVSGVFWMSMPIDTLVTLSDSDIDDLETTGSECLGVSGVIGVSRVNPSLLLARAVASSPEKMREAFLALWEKLRPAVLNRAAITPRIWKT